jgi:hypothetical protein
MLLGGAANGIVRQLHTNDAQNILVTLVEVRVAQARILKGLEGLACPCDAYRGR